MRLKIIERPKRISELPREVQKNIEKITIDGRGRAVPQLYSKFDSWHQLGHRCARMRSAADERGLVNAN